MFGYFQVVVDAIDPRCLISTPVSHTVNFGIADESELYDIVIPLQFSMGAHSISVWVHVLCGHFPKDSTLSTAYSLQPCLGMSMGLHAGLMCSLMGAPHSAGSPLRPVCQPPTGELRKPVQHVDILLAHYAHSL